MRWTSPRSGSTTCRPAGSSRPSASRCATCSRPIFRRRRPHGATRSASGSGRDFGSMPTAGRRRAIRSTPLGWRGRTPASATPRTASTRRCSWRLRTPRRSPSPRPPPAPTSASRSCRPVAGSPKRCARRAISRANGRRWSTSSTSATAHYHWVHAINNTALVAAALYRFDGDFSGAISAVVQGGWDTDTNGAAVGSILGAIVGAVGNRRSLGGAAAGPLRELAARLRRDHARRARAADARRRAGCCVSIPLEEPRDPWSPRPIDRPTPVSLDPEAPLDALDGGEDLRRARRSCRMARLARCR